MSYAEKGSWVYLMVAVATFGAYVSIILGRAGGTPVTDVPYVALLLWMIGVSTVLSTVLRTVFEAADPSETRKSDERDRSINRLGEYVGGLILAGGMVGLLVLAVTEADHFWIANAIYVTFVVQAVTSSTVKLVAYRRGR